MRRRLINFLGGSPLAGGGGLLPPLLLDKFDRAGANLNLNGQIPDIGSPWVTTLSAGGSLVTNAGTMFQSGGTGVGYATSACPALIGEVGCQFTLSAVTNSVVFSGTAANGGQIFCNIFPSRQGSNQIVCGYAMTATDTLATAVAALASVMTANIAGRFGLAVSVAGTTITVTAPECPKLSPAALGAPVTVAQQPSEQPTLATYITGNNFINGTLHFYMGIDGTLLWTVYNNGLIAFSSFTQSTLIGLSANTLYTYRCCVAAPYVWGGLWQGTTLLNSAWAQDNSAIATYGGKSCFFETGGGAQLKYNEVWAYPQPSVPFAQIQAAA